MRAADRPVSRSSGSCATSISISSGLFAVTTSDWSEASSFVILLRDGIVTEMTPLRRRAGAISRSGIIGSLTGHPRLGQRDDELTHVSLTAQHWYQPGCDVPRQDQCVGWLVLQQFLLVHDRHAGTGDDRADLVGPGNFTRTCQVFPQARVVHQGCR